VLEPEAVEPHRHVRGVLDTRTVMLLSRITDPAALPVEPLITAVMLAELTVGPLAATTEAERAARQAHVQQAEADFEPLPFDCGCAGVRASGRFDAPCRPEACRPCIRRYDRCDCAGERTAGVYLQSR
jgi:tRNA(fMet)-specific endonuclease VapC